MAMSGVDYSQRLTEERDRFQRELRQSKKSYNETVDNIERAHKYQQDKAARIYSSELSRQEVDKQDALRDMREKTVDSIKRKTEDFERRLDEERQNFKVAREDQQGRFSKTLSDITTSYRDTIDSDKVLYGRMMDQKRRDYAGKVNRLEDFNEDRFQGFVKDSNQKFRNQRETLLEDKARLARKSQRQLENQQIANNVERGELRRQFGQTITRQQDAFENENVRRSNNTKRRIDRIIKGSKDINERLESDLQSETSRVRQAMKDDRKKENLRFQKEITALERQSAEDEFLMRQLSKRKTNGGTNAEKIQRGLMTSEKIESKNKKIDRLKEFNAELNEKFTDDLAQVKKGYDNDLLQQRVRVANAVTEKERENSARTAEQIAMNRKRSTDVINAFKEKDVRNSKTNESIMIGERARAKEQYDQMVDRYSQITQDLTEGNQRQIEELRKVQNRQKAEYSKRVEKQKQSYFKETRDDFRGQLQAERELHRKVEGQQKMENEKLKDDYESQLELERKRSDNRHMAQRALFEEQRKEDYKALKDLMRRRESELKIQMNDMKLKNDKDLLRMSQDNQKRVKDLTASYELKLQTMVQDFSRRLKLQESGNNRELDRLKHSWESEKKRLINQYEIQIDRTRQNYEAKIQQLSKREA